MAKIPLTNGFTPIEEGVHIFRIYEVIYNEEFGKILVKLVTSQGATHTETFFIKDKNGQYNDKALGAFSYFVKTAMNDFSLEDIDPEQLVNHYIKAEVIHTKVPSTKDPSKTFTYANLGDKSPADGFDVESIGEQQKEFDLDSLLD